MGAEIDATAMGRCCDVAGAVTLPARLRHHDGSVGSDPEASMRSPTAILQLICPDRPGLVSELSGWVAANGGNIRHADHPPMRAQGCS
jgi:hypothetical protein